MSSAQKVLRAERTVFWPPPLVPEPWSPTSTEPGSFTLLDGLFDTPTTLPPTTPETVPSTTPSTTPETVPATTPEINAYRVRGARSLAIHWTDDTEPEPDEELEPPPKRWRLIRPAEPEPDREQEPPLKRFKLMPPESWHLFPELVLPTRVLTQVLKGRVFANRAGRFPAMEVPKRHDAS